MKTIRFGIIGNTDSGKTTITGILSKLPDGEYDDGRGYARSMMFTHKHEKESGRTSSITRETKVVDGKMLEFVDLAGHEAYLKTTIRGLCGYYIDYVLLIVGGNMGVSKMTREHLRLAYYLRIPIIVVVTKTDLAPPQILKQTLIDIKTEIKVYKGFTHKIRSQEEFSSDIIQRFLSEKVEKFYPIFCVSNKTGENIEMLKAFLAKCTGNQKFNSEADCVFNIHSTYSPPGIGLVVSGVLQSGTITKGQTLYMGPTLNKYVKVKVWSIHDDIRIPIDTCSASMSVSLAIKVLDKADKELITRDDIRCGSRIVQTPKMVHKFSAQIYVFKASSNIAEGYEPLINCSSCCQVAKILKVSSANPKSLTPENLGANELGSCTFQFKYSPQYIEEGTVFMFREGITKGVGKVSECFK